MFRQDGSKKALYLSEFGQDDEYSKAAKLKYEFFVGKLWIGTLDSAYDTNKIDKGEIQSVKAVIFRITFKTIPQSISKAKDKWSQFVLQ